MKSNSSLKEKKMQDTVNVTQAYFILRAIGKL